MGENAKEDALSTTKTFKFSFPTCTNENVKFKLEVPVEIPLDGSTRELVQRLINMFHIPVYLEDELNEELSAFVRSETKRFHDERDARALDRLKAGAIDADTAVRHWEKMFKENVLEFAEERGTTDEEVFAAAYHKLVHSAALNTILQVERSYAATVAETLRNRDEDIRKLTEKQSAEMEACMQQPDSPESEAAINSLSGEQWAAAALANARWDSQLDALQRAQRRHHRNWLMATLRQYQTTNQLSTPTNSPLATFSPCGLPTELGLPEPEAGSGAERPLEESFTIHLGSQLKQTHNIRLVAADILDLCAPSRADNPTDASRRLQTSLSLYSSELSAVVVLCPVTAAPRAAGRLAAAAKASTEHHFADIDAQIGDIEERVRGPALLRNQQRLQESGGDASKAKDRLQPGDVFVTRHSNLPEAHIVFHLVVDDNSLRSGEMSSRHPAVLGLRAILRAAGAGDVTALALPLLLRHELTEEMTAAWCLRRAELVLKCVKGFMLETAGGAGAELRTLCCVAPPQALPAVFHALAALPPAIFRVSNPVKIRAERGGGWV